VSGFTDRSLFAAAVLCYGFSAAYSIFLLRRDIQKHNSLNYFTLLGAFVFHTWAMLMRGFSLERCPINNLYEATLFVAWTMTATYLVLGLWGRLRFLGAFAAPVLFAISVFALFTPKDVGSPGHPEFGGGWLTLHIALFALSYGAFGMAAVAGLMYLTQERNLKQHKMRALLSFMPPIQRLDVVIRTLLIAGFVLFTGALALAPVVMHQLGKPFAPDFKIAWSCFVWAIYLGLLIVRWKYWAGGKRFALGAVAAFAFVLLTFWGSSLMSPMHRP
jgi:ABC-type uncharacterized transport system permease subunit